jgi:diguanylate cyclase (GGDEF)-like protein/PAS domain S-box-containing protein
MTERAQLLEATLDRLPDGVGLLDENRHVIFWNAAAQAITGYGGVDLVGRPVPQGLTALLGASPHDAGCDPPQSSEVHRRARVSAHHKLGHEVSTMARTLTLRNGRGERIGTAVLFHPAEGLDALPHGEAGENERVAASQEDLKELLESLFADFEQGGLPFGVLWIRIDQAHDLRRTHGANACEAMFNKVEHALAHGLRPAEHLGRWGEDEILVVSHERSQAMLAMHAQVLAGLARTAEFRWWGDRVPLTVSIGAAQADNASPLADLLQRARAAMQASHCAGGNHITEAPEGHSCSPS